MPSEIAPTSILPDRRTRKRDQRRDVLLDLAADLVEECGVAGLTMSALAEVSDYAPASLYTYFPSRSALVAGLQERALRVLVQVGEDHLAAWDDALGAYTPARSARSARLSALARLWAFADLFLTAPDHHPREFRLQQELLAAPDSDDGSDGVPVITAAMAVLDLPRRLLAASVEVRALAPHREVANPLGDRVDAAMVRTLAWVSAMNGALLLDRLGAGAAVTGFTLGTELTHSLLHGWGANAELLDEARTLANTWSHR